MLARKSQFKAQERGIPAGVSRWSRKCVINPSQAAHWPMAVILLRRASDTVNPTKRSIASDPNPDSNSEAALYTPVVTGSQFSAFRRHHVQSLFRRPTPTDEISNMIITKFHRPYERFSSSGMGEASSLLSSSLLSRPPRSLEESSLTLCHTRKRIKIQMYENDKMNDEYLRFKVQLAVNRFSCTSATVSGRYNHTQCSKMTLLTRWQRDSQRSSQGCGGEPSSTF